MIETLRCENDAEKGCGHRFKSVKFACAGVPPLSLKEGCQVMRDPEKKSKFFFRKSTEKNKNN